MKTNLHRAAIALAIFIGALNIASAEDKIVISNWDGYMPEDLPQKFEEATGIKVEVALHATNEEIMGKVVAGSGKGYDVLLICMRELLNLSMILAIHFLHPMPGELPVCVIARTWSPVNPAVGTIC